MSGSTSTRTLPWARVDDNRRMTTHPPPPADETGSGDSLSDAIRIAFESGRAIHFEFEDTESGRTAHWTIKDVEEPEPETAVVEPEPEYLPEPVPVHRYDYDPDAVTSGDDMAAEYFEFFTDPAAIAATAAASAAVVNKIVGEVGATKRHRMTQETERLRIEAQQASEPPAEEPGTDET